MSSRGKRIVEMAKELISTQKVVVETIPNLDNNDSIITIPFEPSSSNENLSSNKKDSKDTVVIHNSNYDSESCDDDYDKDYIPEDSSSDESVEANTRMEPKKIRLDTETSNHKEVKNKNNEEEVKEEVQVKKQRVVNRKLMREKKLRGEEYLTRKGVLVPAKQFVPLINCCRKKCADKLLPENQKLIFDDFLRNVSNKDQFLSDRIKLTQKKVERKGRSKTGNTKFREITATYFVTLKGQELDICKRMFQNTYGVTRGKVDIIIQKKNASQTGFIGENSTGKQKPGNARDDERQEAINHIDSYPKYESHYSRRHTSKLYFAPTLSIAKIYDMYVNKRKTEGMTQPLSYSVFAKIFNELGYKIKNPSIDTCKTCDRLQNDIKSATTEEERQQKIAEKEKHLELAEKAYDQKKADKEKARNVENQRVVVFDLQQNLPTPVLSTSEVYYKRQLWTYNFTMRDCCTETTTCFMWHEGLSDRGADQIASCVIHFLKDLPENVDTVVFYSDSCPGQNKNNIVAAALSWFLSTSENLKTIEHKFLEVGHSRLECDTDHAKIERAKKGSSEMEIRIPHDWFQFVRTVRGKKNFKVVEMHKEDFLQYSSLLRSVFVKRDRTESGENVRWHDIRVLRFSKQLGPGVIEVKYSHDESEPFYRFNIKRRGNNVPELPLVYNGPKPIAPKKKENLLDLLKYMDNVYHPFYENLTVNENAEDVV